MIFGSLPDRFQDKSFREKELNIMVLPILCWQTLQKHDDFLKAITWSDLLQDPDRGFQRLT